MQQGDGRTKEQKPRPPPSEGGWARALLQQGLWTSSQSDGCSQRSPSSSSPVCFWLPSSHSLPEESGLWNSAKHDWRERPGLPPQPGMPHEVSNIEELCRHWLCLLTLWDFFLFGVYFPKFKICFVTRYLLLMWQWRASLPYSLLHFLSLSSLYSGQYLLLVKFHHHFLAFLLLELSAAFNLTDILFPLPKSSPLHLLNAESFCLAPPSVQVDMLNHDHHTSRQHSVPAPRPQGPRWPAHTLSSIFSTFHCLFAHVKSGWDSCFVLEKAAPSFLPLFHLPHALTLTPLQRFTSWGSWKVCSHICTQSTYLPKDNTLIM